MLAAFQMHTPQISKAYCCGVSNFIIATSILVAKRQKEDRKMLSRAFNFLANAWLHSPLTHLLEYGASPGLMKLCNFDSLFMCTVFQAQTRRKKPKSLKGNGTLFLTTFLFQSKFITFPDNDELAHDPGRFKTGHLALLVVWLLGNSQLARVSLCWYYYHVNFLFSLY